MSHGGVQQFGGGQPPFDSAAQATIAAARARMSPPRPQVLSAEDRAEAEAAAKEAEAICRLCLGLHVHPNTPGCPRLASGKIDGDGKVVEFTFWPGLDWAKGRVILAEDIHEEDAESGEENG